MNPLGIGTDSTLVKVANEITIKRINFDEIQWQSPCGGLVEHPLAEKSIIRHRQVIRGIASPYTVDSAGVLQGSTRVYKVGRTTGYTEGNVTGLAGVSTISYDDSGNDKDARFVDQIVIEATQDNVGPFSDSGDSGSGVENDRHELAGLLFAGNDSHTLVNPIADVISELRTATGIPSLRVVTG